MRGEVVGSVLVRTKLEREGGESVDDERKLLGFSLEVDGFGFNDEELGADDCADIVVVVPKDEPYGPAADDAAGPPDMVDIRCSHTQDGGRDINSGHPSTSLTDTLLLFAYVNKTCR